MNTLFSKVTDKIEIAERKHNGHSISATAQIVGSEIGKDGYVYIQMMGQEVLRLKVDGLGGIEIRLATDNAGELAIMPYSSNQFSVYVDQNRLLTRQQERQSRQQGTDAPEPESGR